MRAVSQTEKLFTLELTGKIVSLRILIADDHDLVRRGVKALLLSHEGWEVCAETSTGRGAVAMATKFKPDVAILDIGMPGLNGLEAAKAIRIASPETEILIISMHQTDQLIREIVDAGVRGYILKSDSERDLVLAVENLANHKTFYAPQVIELILGRFNSSSPPKEIPEANDDRLASRDREIIKLISEGKSTKDLALSLGISYKEAETHRADIMRKLDAHSVSDLVRYALRNRIIEE